MSASNFNKKIDDSNMTLNIPDITITNTSINSPRLFDSFNNSLSRRTFSNLSIASFPETPDVSPIIFFSDSSVVHSNSKQTKWGNTASKHIKIPVYNCLNQRFSISPKRLRFSDASDREAPHYEFTYSNELFHWIGYQHILNERYEKNRHASFNIANKETQLDSNKYDDDVFADQPINVDLKEEELDWMNKYEFKNIRRNHSIDTCISLFRKHEIDMESFYYMSKDNSDKCILDWTKRDDVLEMLYDLSKNC